MDFTKDDLVAFDPLEPANRWKLVARVVQPDRVRLHFFWRRIAVMTAALCLGGWLLTTGAIWGFLFFGREWSEAKYSDLVLYPWRATAIKQGLARHNLARGQTEFARENYRTGYALLIAGLGRFPGDLQARRTVATIQVRSGLLPRALDTLVEGIPFGADLDYLKLTFGWLLEAQQYDRAISVAERILPPTPDGHLMHQFVALMAATAHFECGRFQQAEQLLAAWRLANSLEGVVLLAQIDWETGQATRALERLTGELTRFSQRDELYLHLVRYHRELGNVAEARRIALLRQFNEPQSPGPRIDLLHAYRATNDRAAETRELALYLSEFAGDVKALANLAWYAVDTLQDDLLERVCAAAASVSPAAKGEFELAKVQFALVSGRFREAFEFSTPVASAAIKQSDGSVPLIVGLNAVAAYASGDTTRAGLAVKTFVSQERFTVRDSLWLARELSVVGDDQDARAVLARVIEMDPFAQPVLEELVRIETRTKNQSGLGQFIPKILALPKPSRQILAEALLVIDRVAQPELFFQVRAAVRRESNAASLDSVVKSPVHPNARLRVASAGRGVAVVAENAAQAND